jgi:hypothetical protein
MSDYQEFCESYGGCASDPDFMDDWMDKYLSNDNSTPYQEEDDSSLLRKGKLVHIVKLLASYPAKPVGIIWNKELKEDCFCARANHLTSKDNDDPASWFVRKGFTIRSKEEDGYWYQVIFKASHSETYLSEPELKEYEAICSTLNNDWVVNIRA